MNRTPEFVALLSDRQLAELAREAWKVREHAFILGNTRVGAALRSNDGRVFVGCNVEHKFRSHDVHAEVNAIATMVAGGPKEFHAIVIVAARQRFTPCGGCMDWIMQFGGPDCRVAFHSDPEESLAVYRAHDLMPFYPS